VARTASSSSLRRSPRPSLSFPRQYSQGNDAVIEKMDKTMKEAKVGRVKKDGSTPRFFKTVNVIQRKDIPGYEVELDGRYAILSSGKHNRLVLPTPQLALSVALDWEAIHDFVDLKRMPMYTLSSVAVDADESELAKMRSVIVSILDTDNVCCRPDNDNTDVVELQKQYQDPLVAWMRNEFGIEINVSSSFEVSQPQHTIQRITAFVNALDQWQLSGLYSLTEACLSLITALALYHRVISTEDALRATRLEMMPFERKWGDVPGSTDVRRAEVKIDISTASTFLSLLPPLPKI
jgi:ATP synthase mitochondrial F1 complex assembly factor 2